MHKYCVETWNSISMNYILSFLRRSRIGGIRTFKKKKKKKVKKIELYLRIIMYHKMNGISILAIKIDFMAWTYYVFTKTQLTHSNTEQITGSLPRLGALDNYPTKILNLSHYNLPDTFNICLMVPQLIFISPTQ